MGHVGKELLSVLASITSCMPLHEVSDKEQLRHVGVLPQSSRTAVELRRLWEGNCDVIEVEWILPGHKKGEICYERTFFSLEGREEDIQQQSFLCQMISSTNSPQLPSQ